MQNSRPSAHSHLRKEAATKPKPSLRRLAQAKWELLHHEHSRFLKFLVVGGLNTVFGYGVFAGLYLVGIPPQPAIIIATIVGINFNFFTTGRLVFDSRSLRKLLPFWIGYGVALAVNLIMAEGLLRLGLNPLLVQGLCLPVFVVVAYLINARLVFRDSRCETQL